MGGLVPFAYPLSVFAHKMVVFHGPKAVTGLDRESAHPSQLNTKKGKQKLVIMPTQGDNQSVTPGFAAVQQLPFLSLRCDGWADSLSNPVTAFIPVQQMHCS